MSGPCGVTSSAVLGLFTGVACEIARCARARGVQRGDLFRSSDSTKNREQSVQIVISVMAPCDENTFQLSGLGLAGRPPRSQSERHNRSINGSVRAGRDHDTRRAIDAKGSPVGEAGRPAGGAQPHAARRGFHVTCSNWFAALNHYVQLSLMSVRSFVRPVFLFAACRLGRARTAHAARRPQEPRFCSTTERRQAASIKQRRRLCNRDFDQFK